MANEQTIDKKYLEGLKHRSAKSKETEEGTVNVPVEVALKPEHVMDWVDNGDHVVIVTTDGRKHKVSKKAEKAKE